MRLGSRSRHLGLLCASLLCASLLGGCDFGSPVGSDSTASTYGLATPTQSGSTDAARSSSGDPTVLGGTTSTGSHDTVIATASVGSALAEVTGASRTISITFSSSDGLPVTGFAVSGTSLPADWSAPAQFVCASVSSGSGCVLDLTYTPTAVESGAITVNFIYVDDAQRGTAPGGSITIQYAATSTNHVLATATPTGQITAVPGTGSESVGVNFTTDDGKAATDLEVTTDLESLPPGWSSTTQDFGCAIVSTGSGCELMLHYAPASSGSGALTLGYAYTDGAGGAQTGTVVIPYGTTSGHDSVVATVAPAGEITAVPAGGGQAVIVTFDTDDGGTASNLFLTGDTTTLASGWSGPLDSFGCAHVSTGNACQLRLTYAPTSLATGTVTLGYGYTDSSGAAQRGTLDIAYAATTDDAVIGTAAPSGEIEAIVGMTNPTVTVSFDTNDARAATALTLNLAQPLPAGWSLDDSELPCAGVGAGQPCALGLTYTPTAAATGSLTLGYTYRNNAGTPLNGTLVIPYRATTNDTVLATPTPAALTVDVGSSTPVSIAFATNDGNPASSLALTSALSALPPGWTSAQSSFACTTVSAGTACVLTLDYAPTAPAAGELNLSFNYTNDAGIPKSVPVSVAYSASTPPPPPP